MNRPTNFIHSLSNQQLLTFFGELPKERLVIIVELVQKELLQEFPKKDASKQQPILNVAYTWGNELKTTTNVAALIQEQAYAPNFNAMEESFGAWEETEESLEELLAMI